MSDPLSPDRDLVRRALGEVFDPCCADRGVSILDMGVVEDVRVTDGHVDVDVIPTTGWCPFVANMTDAIDTRLRRIDGVRSVGVHVVWEPAWTPDRLSEFARETLAMPLAELEPYRRRRLAATQGA